MARSCGRLCALLCALAAWLLVGTAVMAGEDGEEVAVEPLRIGVVMKKMTDTGGSAVKKLLDDTARALDAKILYAEHGNDQKLADQTAELLCDAGCRGIVYCGVSDEDREAAIRICGERGVFLVEAYRKLDAAVSPALYELAAAEPYYKGNVYSLPSETDYALLLGPDIDRQGQSINEDTAFYAFLLAYGLAAGSNGDTGQDPYYTIAVPWPGEGEVTHSAQEVQELVKLTLPELAAHASAGAEEQPDLSV